MEVLKSLHTFILYICSAKALANSSDFQLNVTTQGTASCPLCLLAAHSVQMTCIKLFRDHFSKQGVKITYSWDPLTMKISNYFLVSRETLTEIISDILIVDQQKVIQFSSP